MQNILRILFHIFIVKPLLYIIVGYNVIGYKNLVINKQVIIIANHNSHLDTLLLLNLFPLKQLQSIRPVAASEYFLQNPIIKFISTVCLNILPISRVKFSKTNNPLRIMSERIRENDSLIIFPEGTRGNPEEMQRFKIGVGHLIQKFPDVLVQPIFVRGAGRNLPKGEVVLVPFFCDLVIGESMKFTNKTKEEIVQELEAKFKSMQAL